MTDGLLKYGGTALIFVVAGAISQSVGAPSRAVVFWAVLLGAYLLLSLAVKVTERRVAKRLGFAGDLPVTGFIVGRAASQADVEAGNAVFATEVEGVSTGVPLAIEVPQYAWLADGETKPRKPVIILQAEHANGSDLVGFVDIETSVVGVATLGDFELLGRAAPK